MSAATPLDDAQLADSVLPAGADPFDLFEEWFAAAQVGEINDPNAMALATATADAAPSVRMVLLKGHGAGEIAGGGFTFFTNAESRKGAHIRANMQAALLFHWKSLRPIKARSAARRVTSRGLCPNGRPISTGCRNCGPRMRPRARCRARRTGPALR